MKNLKQKLLVLLIIVNIIAFLYLILEIIRNFLLV